MNKTKLFFANAFKVCRTPADGVPLVRENNTIIKDNYASKFNMEPSGKRSLYPAARV